MGIHNYRDLEVWQKSMDLVVFCYDVVKQFPSDERYGLISQLRRAAVSVPANIAEGHARNHTKEFLQHLSIAYASLMEIETHLQIAQRINYINDQQLHDLLQRTTEIGRMLNGLKRSLAKNLNS